MSKELTPKEKLILSIISDNNKKINEHLESVEESIEEYESDGFGDVHPANIESIKSNLQYTKGYCIGYKNLFDNINKLLNMTATEIEEEIEKGKIIREKNRKELDRVFARFKINRIEESIEKTAVRCEIYCPKCKERHIDKGEWATNAKAHRKHLCEHCGNIWKHKDYYTVGC